ncbi:MAG: hypothetical protein U0904_09710 [Candidatus Nanopelagicales bacterium]|nr:hypothetical protein [Candidatus Nanopelagicales bacterium]
MTNWWPLLPRKRGDPQLVAGQRSPTGCTPSRAVARVGRRKGSALGVPPFGGAVKRKQWGTVYGYDTLKVRHQRDGGHAVGQVPGRDYARHAGCLPQRRDPRSGGLVRQLLTEDVNLSETDLVAHCGYSARGEFAYTLNLTDVCSGWTEPEAIRSRPTAGSWRH